MERFTGRVFQLPTQAFFPRHAALLAGLRGLLAPGELRPHASALHQAARRHLTERWPARGEVRVWVGLEGCCAGMQSPGKPCARKHILWWRWLCSRNRLQCRSGEGASMCA